MSSTLTDTVTNNKPAYKIGELLCDEVATSVARIPKMKKHLGMITEHIYDKIWNRWLYRIYWIEDRSMNTHDGLYTENEVHIMKGLLKDWYDCST